MKSLCLALAILGQSPYPPVGINTGGNTPYETTRAYVDIARMMRPWKAASGAAVVLTPDGYPTADAVTASQFASEPAGTYKVSYRGKATLTVSGRGSSLGTPATAPDGRTTLDLVLPLPGRSWVTLGASGLDPGAPMSDLRVIRPRYDPAAYPTFTPDFMAPYRPFAGVRLMAILATNGNPAVHWADRTMPGEFPQTGLTGICYEDAVEFANRVGTPEVWVNAPDLADDDYHTRMANLFHDGLAPGTRVKLEFSNELWNMAFAHALNQMKLARSDPRLTAYSDLGRAAQLAALNTQRVGALWRAAWGADAGRVKVVVGGQSNQASFCRISLAFLATKWTVSDVVDFVSIGPYVGLGTVGDQDGLTTDLVFATLNQNLKALVLPGIAAHAALAQQYGLGLVAYEGGQSVIDYSNARKLAVSHDAKAAAQDDPRMAQLHRDLLAGWKAAGGGVFYIFGPPVSVSTQYGYWGLRTDPTLPGSTKWDAVLGMVLPAGDVDGDGKVSFADFLSMQVGQGRWRADGDLDGDQQVGQSDLILLQRALGPSLTDEQSARVQAAITP